MQCWAEEEIAGASGHCKTWNTYVGLQLPAVSRERNFCPGVPCFLANGAISCWIKFQGYQPPAVIVTLLHGLAVAYLVASHARWFNHLFGSKPHPALQVGSYCMLIGPFGLEKLFHCCFLWNCACVLKSLTRLPTEFSSLYSNPQPSKTCILKHCVYRMYVVYSCLYGNMSRQSCHPDGNTNSPFGHLQKKGPMFHFYSHPL